jgi:hypothetical protein
MRRGRSHTQVQTIVVKVPAAGGRRLAETVAVRAGVGGRATHMGVEGEQLHMGTPGAGCASSVSDARCAAPPAVDAAG